MYLAGDTSFADGAAAGALTSQ
eukprot:COSAG01_NODE_35889_length_525_cov_0.840376_1_plen_21_part_10